MVAAKEIKAEKTPESKIENQKELKLGGNIALVGFEVLDPIEIAVVKKIVGNYVKKMCENAGYKELRLTLQEHQKGKTFLHEIDGQAIFSEGKFGSNVQEWNLYTALASVLEKILAEVVHSTKKGPRHDKPSIQVAREEEASKLKFLPE